MYEHSLYRPFKMMHVIRATSNAIASNHLTVGLGNTLNLVLLLDGVAVRRTLCSVDELISKALSNGLDVPECGLTGASGQQVDGLVDTAKRGDIDGLATDHTGRTDTGSILTGTTVDDGIYGNLDGVGVREKVDDLESVLDDADRHQLLAVVAAVHHQRVHHPLHDRALSLAEALPGITASGVGNEGGVFGLHGDVVLQRDVVNLDILEVPLAEERDFSCGSWTSHDAQ